MIPFHIPKAVPRRCDNCDSANPEYPWYVLEDLGVVGSCCENCVRSLGSIYKGTEKRECYWCGVLFIQFREGGFRRAYWERGVTEISFCWNCLDAIAEDLRRASQTASAGERRARLIQAIPGWADRKAIKAVYEEARRISRETGIPHQVDHEIPLNSPFVSGFHVAENLQILPASENLKKSNRLNVNSKAIKCKSEQPKESVEVILDQELKELLAQAAKQELERRKATMKPRLIKRR